MDMSSEIAGKIAVTALGEITTAHVAKYVDSQLQEVRAVLTRLAPRTNIDAEGGHCWCSKNLTDNSEPHDKEDYAFDSPNTRKCINTHVTGRERNKRDAL